MPIIVVLDLRTKPETNTSVVEDAVHYFRGPGSAMGGRSSVSFVQDADDPSRLLYVVTWDSRTAYEQSASTPGLPADERLEAIGGPRFFEPIRTFEVVFGAGSAIACVLFEGTPEQAGRREAEILAYAEARDHRADGVVRYAIGREIDHPENHLLVMQYRTAQQYATVRAAAIQTIMARLVALGCRYRRFYGDAILDLDREDPSGPPPRLG